MMDFSFWYAAAPFFLIGLGTVAAFIGSYSFVRWMCPAPVKLRRESEVPNNDRGPKAA